MLLLIFWIIIIRNWMTFYFCYLITTGYCLVYTKRGIRKTASDLFEDLIYSRKPQKLMNISSEYL